MFMFYCHSFIHQKHIYKKYRSGKCIVNVSKKNNSSSENRGLAHNLRLSHIMRLFLFLALCNFFFHEWATEQNESKQNKEETE